MGTSLNGLTPAGTYPGLIKTGDNAPIDGTLKTLSDGNGNNLPMAVSATAVNFTNQLQQSGVAVPTASQVAAKQDTLVSGTNIKTVNSTSLLGSGNVAVQDVLVSGTNIKTINSTSLLGSGNIAVVTSPSGVAGAIQFSNGSAFASDAANLFWDDTNNRLGVGTNVPSATGHFRGAGTTSITTSLLVQDSAGTNLMSLSDNGVLNLFSSAKTGQLIVDGGGISGIYTKAYNSLSDNVIRYKDWNANQCMMLTMTGSGTGSLTVNNGITPLGATLGIKGSGSTSATTSLLVQNSAGSEAFRVYDNRTSLFSREVGINTAPISQNTLTVQAIALGSDVLRLNNVAGTLIAEYYVDGSGNGEMYIRNNAGTTKTLVTSSGGASYFIDPLVIGASSINTSAILQADSTTRGFLPPRMTTTQKNAIATPAAGLVVYDNTTNKLQCYNGSSWNDLF